VVTLELAVRFLSLARTSRALAFHARVVRSSRNFAFVEGELRGGEGEVFASASGMVAPA
jgi:acyl-coenzyme A thioesterase PaaI-like protein